MEPGVYLIKERTVDDLDRNVCEELNCAEEVLDGLSVDLGMEKTDFDCIGDYIKAVFAAQAKCLTPPAQPAQAEVTVPDDMSHAGEIKIKIAPDGDIHITASGKDTWTGNDATVVIELTSSGGRDGAKWHSIFRAAMLTATTPTAQPAVPDLTHDQTDY